MKWALVALALLVLAQAAHAQALDIRGRAVLGGEYAYEDSKSFTALIGENTRSDALGDLRLIWQPHEGAWDFDLAYQLTADAGDTPVLTRYENLLRRLVVPPTTLFDLSDTFINGKRFSAIQRIDRLSLSYTSDHLVIRLGRQALTWGSGLVFHPVDLFDPFAPNAIDTEYKPGADMLYAQYLFEDGSDLQFVVVPRPTYQNGPPDSNESSFALHYHRAIGGFQTTWLLARDRRDVVAAIGVNGSLGGATWNVEVEPTFVRAGPTLMSAIANVSDATTLFGRDATLFAEYFRNGFGESARHYDLIDLSQPLILRLFRGQMFVTGRDYLAAGSQLQWTPLLEIDPTLIVNLDDHSLYAIAEATYSLRENLNLVLGAQIPAGPERTEFGGVAFIGAASPFYEHPATMYVQLRRYF
jgi:hypothetical protein